MNLRGDRPPHDGARSIFAAMTALAAVAMLVVSGCKTGGTNSALAWWPGTSKGSADNEKLASAPSFDGKVEKPSETQSPYPTTTTPQSYAIDGQKPPSLASAGPPPGAVAPPSGNSPVTYGATPPTAASNPTAAATPPNPGTIAAQVGPYQGWPAGGGGPAAPSTPPTSTPAPAAAALGFGSASSMTPDALEPPARYADARFGGATAAPAAAAPATTPQQMPAPAMPSEPAAAVPTSRYATSAASQFGTAPAEAPAAPAAFVPAAAPPSAPPQVAPAAEIAEPSAFAPQSGVNRLRAPSASAEPPSSPGRRPDPGYRPGGTSTYRPSQAIVDEPADDRPVRQASFDSPLR